MCVNDRALPTVCKHISVCAAIYTIVNGICMHFVYCADLRCIQKRAVIKSLIPLLYWDDTSFRGVLLPCGRPADTPCYKTKTFGLKITMAQTKHRSPQQSFRIKRFHHLIFFAVLTNLFASSLQVSTHKYIVI